MSVDFHSRMENNTNLSIRSNSPREVTTFVMLNIYHVPHTRSLRVLWLCEELDLPYQLTTIDFSKEYRATSEWRSLNPIGKVPVLTDGDLVMFESGAMLQYILDRYGDGKLQPRHGTPGHAHFLQWCWFGEATFARPLGEIFNHKREFPGEREIPEVIEEMKNRARECVKVLDDHLAANDYMLGLAFSGADIMNAYSLHLANLVGIFQGIEDLNYPGLARYWQRLHDRNSFIKAFSSNH